MGALSSFGIPVPVHDLTPDARIVTRQQLRDPEFYRTVKAGLLDGTVAVADQRGDFLKVDGVEVSMTETRALEALAESQATWVGQQPANPFLDSLMGGAS